MMKKDAIAVYADNMALQIDGDYKNLYVTRTVPLYQAQMRKTSTIDERYLHLKDHEFMAVLVSFGDGQLSQICPSPGQLLSSYDLLGRGLPTLDNGVGSSNGRSVYFTNVNNSALKNFVIVVLGWQNNVKEVTSGISVYNKNKEVVFHSHLSYVDIIGILSLNVPLNKAVHESTLSDETLGKVPAGKYWSLFMTLPLWGYGSNRGAFVLPWFGPEGTLQRTIVGPGWVLGSSTVIFNRNCQLLILDMTTLRDYMLKHRPVFISHSVDFVLDTGEILNSIGNKVIVSN